MSGFPQLVVVLDFDGTVTTKDVGDEVCNRFAPPAWREIDAAWVRNELSLPEAQRQMWALARCERQEAVAYARQVGVIRPGLDALLSRVAERGAALWLASGGFDFYIEAILDGNDNANENANENANANANENANENANARGRLARFQRTFFNQARFVDSGVQVSFPHAELACDRCAVCKGKVCDLARMSGARVIFIGDGASDRCAIGRADALWAVRGSLLERVCRERGAPCQTFEALDEVALTSAG